jgi:putative acetyltransferase
MMPGAFVGKADLRVRLARSSERSGLVGLWERSVRATHSFLTEADIVFYRPLTAEILMDEALEIWVVTNEADLIVGFLGLSGESIEALFLEPSHLGRGGGRRLVAHAEALSGGTLTVDVNEQNVGARGFYEALGFVAVGRSATDGTGRPYPLLHLRRDPPRPAAAGAAGFTDQREPRPTNPERASCRNAEHAMTPVSYTIGQARLHDLPLLSAIELAAARLLVDHAPARVLAETTSDEILENASRHGRLWVARADDIPVGFAHVELLEPEVAHLAEVDVHPLHGRRGLGRRLVQAVCAWAAAGGYRSVTLTTFRDVPWNMPFYARLGFDVIVRAELSPALRSVIEDETRRGLDPTRRVAMRHTCVSPPELRLIV